MPTNVAYYLAPEISIEEQKKYAGRHVAIVDGKIVAVGNNSKEVYDEAKRKFPDKKSEEIGLLFIPREEYLIL